MHQPFPVSVFERVAALEGNVQHLGHGQQGVGRRKVGQWLAVHVFEHQIRRQRLFVRIQQAHDVGVAQAARQRGLVAQQLAVALGLLGHLQQVRVGLLDGHLAAPKAVQPQVHDATGAPPQFALDAVLADVGGRCRGGCGHGGAPVSGWAVSTYLRAIGGNRSDWACLRLARRFDKLSVNGFMCLNAW